MKVITPDNIKLFFIYVAYVAYSLSVIVKTQLNYNLGNFEYIFVFIIFISIKIAQSTKMINNVVNNVDLSKMDNLLEQLITVSSDLQTSSRTLRMINEPFTEIKPEEPTPLQTQREDVSDNYIIKVLK